MCFWNGFRQVSGAWNIPGELHTTTAKTNREGRVTAGFRLSLAQPKILNLKQVGLRHVPQIVNLETGRQREICFRPSYKNSNISTQRDSPPPTHISNRNHTKRTLHSPTKKKKSKYSGKDHTQKKILNIEKILKKTATLDCPASF